MTSGIVRFLLTAFVVFCGLPHSVMTELLASEFAPPPAKLFGRVSVVGLLARPAPLRVFKNRAFCGTSVANETLLVGKEGELQNAVVTLHAIGKSPTIVPTEITLDNRRCAFVPHVQVAPIGSELTLTNSDRILHTVHARIGTETLFNVGLPHWRRVSKRLDRSGVIRVDCDVLHTWMTAAIVVTTTPYFAVTDSKGAFAIPELAAGDYRVDVWHERLGAKSARVSISTGAQAAVDVVYTATIGR
jgi:hypothetical protein